MKCKSIKKVVSVLFVLALNVSAVLAASEYDIQEVYVKSELPDEIKAIESDGDLVDVKYLLKPIKLDVGTYKESVRRIGTNLYEIEGTSIVIQTRYCYEYGYGDEVYIEIESSYGYSKGKIIFD